MSNTITRNGSIAPYLHMSKHGVKRGTIKHQVKDNREPRQPVTLSGLFAWLTTAAVVAAPIYLIGVTFLTAQIMRTYGLDFGTAWYAASSVPQLGILGVAIDVLRRGWENVAFFTIAGLFWVGATLSGGNREQRMFDYVRESWTGPKPSPYSGRVRLFMLWLHRFPYLLAFAIILYLTALMLFERLAAPAYLTYSIIAFMTCAGFVLVQSPQSLRWRVIVAFALLYLIAVFSTLADYGVGMLHLPVVEVGTETNTQTRGQLLNHSDGYWYVLTHNPDSVTAIPDDTAKTVRTYTEGKPTNTPIGDKTP